MTIDDYVATEHLCELGHGIADDGLERHAASVADVARAGRSLVPVAAAVLADPAEPSVARLRAFAIVSAALERDETPGAGTDKAAA